MCAPIQYPLSGRDIMGRHILYQAWVSWYSVYQSRVLGGASPRAASNDPFQNGSEPGGRIPRSLGIVWPRLSIEASSDGYSIYI